MLCLKIFGYLVLVFNPSSNILYADRQENTPEHTASLTETVIERKYAPAIYWRRVKCFKTFHKKFLIGWVSSSSWPRWRNFPGHRESLKVSPGCIWIQIVLKSLAIRQCLRTNLSFKNERPCFALCPWKAQPMQTMRTGENFEVLVWPWRFWMPHKTPPFQLNDNQSVGEDVRLKHRFIDLRRPEVPSLKMPLPFKGTVCNYVVT